MIDRRLVMKALLPVADFLGKCYPCGCAKGAASHPDDECPGEIHEAEEVVRIVLDAVAADIREGVLWELHERLGPCAHHENTDGIWVAQSVIEEMVEEEQK